MNREKIAWFVSGSVLCYLALQVPGSLAQRDEDFRFVRTLVDIYRQVDTNYVEDVEQKTLQQAAISGMLNSLDPYTMYVPGDEQDAFNDALDGNFKGVGIRLNINAAGQIEIVTPIDDSPAWKAGVLPGDIILKIDGESVVGKRIEDIVDKVKGPDGTNVTLTLQRQTDVDKTLDITLTRSSFAVPMIKGFARNADNTWTYWADEKAKIAYVRLTQFTPEIGAKITILAQQLMADGMKGLVFDVRFNPGGRLEEAEQLIDLFVKEGVMVTVKGRNRPEQKIMAKPEGTLPDFPMVVLVNEHSASASEVLAGALKDNHRATVVGARTYGKGSVQEVMPLDANAGELKITVAYWYLPSGKRVQKLKDATEWGVEPDVVVPMDDAQQERLVTAQVTSEMMRLKSPTTKPATRLTTGATTQSKTLATPRAITEPTTQATTEPSTQSIDPQLDKAIDVIREKIK